ncbi:hypothetical protein [Nocardioides aquiterrae]|uniref:DUF222 domain-containing protein n=1 Tax=Nocardioides aquiterrae TaxID=203799 RepID=A0ABN1UDU6_9ACTN
MVVLISEDSPAAVLAASEAALTERRTAQVKDLLLVLQWADLHGGDPQREPGAVPARFGGDKLVELGGDGTPSVQDLCVHELAIARQTHPMATRSTMADALDLRHRLPRVWAQVVELACEPWVACKVARMSRRLDRHQVEVVDAAVAEAIGGQSPGRVLTIAEAKVIEADTAAHAARLEEERRRRGVWLSVTDVETGTRGVFARVEPSDAVWVDAMLERIVDAFLARPDILRAHHPDLPAALDDLSRDELRAIAFGWLARPDDVRELLAGAEVRRKPHHSAVVYLHLHESAVAGTSNGMARVERLGPMLLEQVTRLLGHAQVTVKPVLDLDEHTSVNAYEFPSEISERTRLRCVGDVFPYAAGVDTMTGRYDDDHAVPFDPGGPPGQTGDHNDAPLSRSNHRAKTHRGYRLRQIDDGTYLWTSPHGLHRLVDPTGTYRVTDTDVWMLEHADELDAALDRLYNELVTTVS